MSTREANVPPAPAGVAHVAQVGGGAKNISDLRRWQMWRFSPVAQAFLLGGRWQFSPSYRPIRGRAHVHKGSYGSRATPATQGLP